MSVPVWRGSVLEAGGCAAGLDDEISRQMRSLRARVCEGASPGVVSCVYKAGALDRVEAFGFADAERRSPMRPDSIVHLYSLTKSVVSVAAGVLMDRGLLSPDDLVCKFIPAFGRVQVAAPGGGTWTARRRITVLHLMTHTSGIGYGPLLGSSEPLLMEARHRDLAERARLGRVQPSHPRAVGSLARWCQELARIPLEFEPGEGWLYSYGHDVLGHVVEVVAGQGLDDFLQECIFQPLKMVDTGFTVPPQKWSRMAGLYRRSGDGGLARVDHRSKERNEWSIGTASPILSGGGTVEGLAGGLVSTCRDYARFCLMLLKEGEMDDHRILTAEMVRFLSVNQLPRATGMRDMWFYGMPGVGVCPLGFACAEHPDLDPSYCAGEYGMSSASGASWTIDPRDRFFVLSFSLVVDDHVGEERLRAALRAALSRLDHSGGRPPPSLGVAKAPVGEALCPPRRRAPGREAAAALIASWLREFATVRAGLMRMCADEQRTTLDGTLSLLHCAASQGALGIARSLCRRGRACMGVNAMSLSGDSPLALATYRGHLGIVRCLCDARADTELRNARDRTPLIYAAGMDYVAITRCLADASADVNAACCGQTPLNEAASSGFVGVVGILCAARANPNDRDVKGATPLVAAAVRGHADVVDALVRYGAMPDGVDDGGRTPLLLAASYGGAAAVGALCAVRADFQRACLSTTTPLFRAAAGGFLDVVRCLCEAGARMDTETAEGATPLLMSAAEGHADVVRYLCGARAELERAMRDGATPLFVAAWRGHAEVSDVLCVARADMQATNISGDTPLMAAVVRGDVATTRCLCRARANLDVWANGGGASALQGAAASGHLEVMRTLIEFGASKDREDASGSTPLSAAASMGHLEVVRFLIGAGARVETADGSGATPLHVAAHKGFADISSLLVDARAMLERPRLDGRTPLYIAAAMGHAEVVQVLCGAGADKERPGGPPGMTPLLVAAWAGRASAAHALCRAGADVDGARRRDGATPLFVSAFGGHLEVVQMLTRARSDPSRATTLGTTPLQCAELEGHTAVVDFLGRMT